MPNIFSDTAKISKLSDIESSVKGSILEIGDETVVDSFVKIKFAGGIGDIKIGEKCYINSGCVLYSGNGIYMGNNVIVAANCVFAPTNHAYSDRSLPIRDQGFLDSKGGVVIEDNVWIGANTVILDGVIIKAGCVIGANSLVRGQLKSHGIYAGSPTKFIRST